MTPVTVIGAGLAGCECAWQLAGRGIPVRLIEMKPKKMTPAHVSENFAELVCSNSLRSDELTNAVGLLKEELRRLDSVVLASADHNRVAAGGALAVDREAFAREITERICAHPNITVERAEADAIPDGEVVIATGPLTSDAMAEQIQRLCPEFDLHFYDAVAPIVTLESVDMDSAFFASRYDKGTADYVNCPMDQAEYTAFVQELRNAKEAPIHGFDDGAVFEGCMPVEVMARRGEDTLRYGPLKPVGLRDPRTGKDNYAVVQLRRDNAEGTLYNIVGFQTHLTFGEQKRVFSMIPALRNAEFVRYGVMHRNTYLNSPAAARPVLPPPASAAHPLRRADDRRRGLCGVVRVRRACRHRDGRTAARPAACRFPAGDGHRRAVPVHFRRQRRRFSTHEHQLWHHHTAGSPRARQAQ